MAAKRTTRAPAKRTAPREIPVLTLKVNGPKVRKGRISVPDLIKICSDAQNAVTRQAEALEGRKSLHPGPTTGQIRQECTLELMAIRDGSTMLDFSLAKPQLPLPFDDAKSFGTEAVGEVAETIRSLGNGNQQQDIDPGVLQSIYGLTSVVESGRITSVNWIAPKSASKKVDGPITKTVRERVASRLSGPSFKVVQIDGVLDMADFSRRERKCRIDPAIGASVICAFTPDKENAVQALLRQPVRAHGLAKILPHSDKIDSLEIHSIEPLPSLSLGEGNFFKSLSIEQLADTQGAKPIMDARTLAGLLTDDEVDGFIAEIYDAREPS